MKTWAIVPVKRLSKSKSRLRGLLTSEQRVELSKSMLIHILTELSEVPEIERTLVVSPDPAVLALAEEHGVEPVEEHGTPALNSALIQATEYAAQNLVDAILVLPADLPLIQAGDIQTVILRGQDGPAIVIAPDRKRNGTNALMVAPPGTIEFAFGQDSFNRHLGRAEASGARVEVIEDPSLGLDVDAPEDYQIYKDRVALVKE